MPKYWYGWIEIRYDLVELDFLLHLVCAVLFYPAVFEMCSLRTDNHSNTRIDKDHTLLLGRHNIFADRWKHLSCGKHNMKLYRIKT